MTVRFDPSRVVELWAPRDSAGTVGSGYRLGGGFVITARHVVERTDPRDCEVRPLAT
jgi:hypothetical protein